MTRLTHAGTMALVLLLAVGCGSAPTPQAAAFQNYVDRQAIETTLVRYSTGLDTFDPDIYASVFTEDAEFTMEGKVFHGAAPGRFIHQFDEACSVLACVRMRSQSVIISIGGIMSSSMNSIESYNTGELIWIWVSLGYLDKPG